MKAVILTGLRANNDLHIGNYFGALLPLIDMAKTKADEYAINLFVPDLHSFTTPTDLSQLQPQVLHNLKLFAAAGLPLNHDNIHIYRQSYIPAHSELAWILSCFTGFGEMSRMTQFKDKSAKIAENRIGVGLFSYPILMAADILLYNTTYVPVGDDQTQHLEFARDIAERINAMAAKYGHEAPFVVPKPVKDQHEFFGKDQGLRIKDLQDPSKKMSKSEETDKGIIFLGDNPQEAAKKVTSAATDSVGAVNYDPENQPGVSNLLQVYALLSNRPLDSVIQQYGGQASYGDLKKEVAEQVAAFLVDFQSSLAAVNETALLAKLQADEAAMNAKANETLLKVQKAVGLR
jgi:tryptophanyl-tRNA synthetase